MLKSDSPRNRQKKISRLILKGQTPEAKIYDVQILFCETAIFSKDNLGCLLLLLMRFL